MRVVVVGGTGHIGSFLVPRLIRAGHEVVSVSRGTATAYVDQPEWADVEQIVADRHKEDADGTFAGRIGRSNADTVIDLLCFTAASAQALVDGLRGRDVHLITCGSVWRAGPSATLPVTEETAPPPAGEYGTAKDAIARLLVAESRSGGLLTTSLHPGHISGPGWPPIGPTGNVDPAVWWTLSAGEPLTIPGIGAETMAHVHADDVAQAFALAVAARGTVNGEDFFVTAADALNVRGYAELGASWFGQAAKLETVTWPQFWELTDTEHARTSWEHLWRSQVCSIDRARRLLGYTPEYTAAQTVLEAVRAWVDGGRLSVARPMVV